MTSAKSSPDQIYSNNFYSGQAERSYQSALQFTPLVYSLFPFIKSVADVGCGVGTTLKAWTDTIGENASVLGIDGNKVDSSFFYIPSENLIQADITSNNAFGMIEGPFDLVESLEVAEHLDESKAEFFIQNLTSLSDIVLFSAAAPFQGGTHHVNEQAPAYWAALFKKYNYVCFNILRDKIWDNQKIAWWYCQNMMLFVQKEKVFLLEEQGYTSTECPKLYYHSRCVSSRLEAHERRRNTFVRRFTRKVEGAIKRFFRG